MRLGVMTRSEALSLVDGILGRGDATWQEKKDLLADLLLSVGQPSSKESDNFNFD